MRHSLGGQRVLVTGRGSGIAGAVTEAVRDAGAFVVVPGLDREDLEAGFKDALASPPNTWTYATRSPSSRWPSDSDPWIMSCQLPRLVPGGWS